MKKTLVGDVYDEFLSAVGADERAGQREAVRLLIELSGKKDPDQYGISAPTGTGKSYAALLAGVYNARLGRRTVIGTSTVVLSEQYARDMQVVRDVFPDVRFSLLKGAAHYFCGRKTAEELAKARGTRKREMLGQLKAFDRGDVAVLPIWATADPEYCATCAEKMRKTGAGKSPCDYAKARAAAIQADVVVTTHAMIKIDMSMRALGKGKSTTSDGVLGRIHLTVFDEAHNAANSLIYDEQFGVKSANYMNWRDVLDVMSPTRRRDFIDHFEKLKEDGWNEEQKWVEPSPELAARRLAVWPTNAECVRMQRIVKDSGSITDAEKFKLRGMVDFLWRGRELLEDIEDGSTNGMVAFWTRGGSYKMREMLPDEGLVKELETRRVAWMSATLGTVSKPKYSLDKCGLSSVELFELESPFDYSSQLKWTVRVDSEVASDAVMVSGLNGWMSGGCLVLTPYHARKEKMTERLRAAMPGTLVQMQAQGQGSATADKGAVEAHKNTAGLGGSPVLVGVEVFSTGIDLPGNELVKLVIADLFPLRDDRAFQAWRGRWLEAVGGDGFRDYELPERAVMLEQQIGRVVRRTTDSGVVLFYVSDKDWKYGSGGREIISEALSRFAGAVKF